MPLNFLNASSDLYLHFLLERLVSFPLGYHVADLFWELGFVAPIITLRFLVILSVFIGGNRGEQLRFIFFLSPFEIGVDFFF